MARLPLGCARKSALQESKAAVPSLHLHAPWLGWAPLPSKICATVMFGSVFVCVCMPQRGQHYN